MACETLGLRHPSGDVADFPVARWFGNVPDTEQRLLDEVVGPALDVGCGPGRHTLALAERGVPTLGIDVCEVVLGFARERRAPVLQRSIFERIPASGRWATALLLDGNLGLGGDPRALLSRLARVLRPSGRVLVEVDDNGGTPETTVRFESAHSAGPWFTLARVGRTELPGIAGGSGWRIAASWRAGGRHFSRLERQ